MNSSTINSENSHPLAGRILGQLREILTEAEQAGRPLEVPPYRERLFELFVVAHQAGLTDDQADPDLSADGLCQILSAQSGLTAAARDAQGNLTALSGEHLKQMRVIWSLMRLWMEWTYAWQRWPDFHADAGT